MSISTTRGDAGDTSLPGGSRISKSELRVEAYGTIDELISSLGLARSLCRNAEIQELTKSIQRELFKVGSAISASRDSRKPPAEIGDDMIARLTGEVHRTEAIEGIFSDWALPGEDVASAAYDVARTICRRAERLAVRLSLSAEGPFDSNVVRYLNRLSDLLWLIGRRIEVELNIDSRLRQDSTGGSRWSPAW
jgi:cob(I)alamin adenosyltransferase